MATNRKGKAGGRALLMTQFTRRPGRGIVAIMMDADGAPVLPMSCWPRNTRGPKPANPQDPRNEANKTGDPAAMGIPLRNSRETRQAAPMP